MVQIFGFLTRGEINAINVAEYYVLSDFQRQLG